MTFFQTLKKKLWPSSTSVKAFRSVHLGKSFQENQIILQVNDQVADDLAQGREQCDDIASYISYERGALERAHQATAHLSESLDALWLTHSNDQEKTCQEVEAAELVCEQHKRLREPRARRDLDTKEVRQRKQIELAPLLEEMICLKRLRVTLDQGLQALSQQLPHGIDHRKGYSRTRFWLMLGIVVASACEGVVVFNSLKVLRAALWLEAITAVGISVGLFALSKGIVYLASKANYLLWRVLEQPHQEDQITPDQIEMGWYDIGTAYLTLFGLLFTTLLGAMRVQYLSETGVDLSWMSAIFTYLVGPFMFVVTIVLSMMLSNPAGGVKAYYTQVLRQFQRIERKIQRLHQKLVKKRTGYVADTTAIQHAYQDAYQSRIDDRQESLRDTLLTQTNSQNATLVLSRQAKLQLLHQLQALLWMSRGLMEAKTNNPGYQWPKLNLPDLLAEPNYQRPFAAAMKPNSNHTSMKTTASKTVQRNGATLIKTLFIVLALGLGLGACAPQTPPTETLVLHVVDHTAYNDQQPQVTSVDIEALVGLDRQPTEGIEYIATTINDLSLNQVARCGLPMESGTLYNDLERADEVQNFREIIQPILTDLYVRPDTNFESTRLYVPLAELLTSYADDPRPKIVILQSDMIQNTDQLSFVGQEPALSEQPTEITAQLEALHALPALAGYDIRIVYQPDTENDRLFAASARLFSDLFREHGATVSIQANL